MSVSTTGEDANAKPVIAIVRPDGIIGAYVFGADGVKAYLQKVFI